MAIPLIAISSPQAGAGKTTLAFNLASALLRDGYRVGIYSHESSSFLAKRAELCKNNSTLKMPVNICKEDLLAENYDGCDAVIADIQTEQNFDLLTAFCKIHTLITLVQNENDIKWLPSDPYLNLIWSIKKHQASAGAKYLNWTVLENKASLDNDALNNLILSQARRFGFRAASPLQNRESYKHIKDGYSAADLICSKTLSMSMEDVYARRELLVLADFIWQHK